MQPLALGAVATRVPGASTSRGRNGVQRCTYILSGIAFSAVRSPTVPSLEHGLSSLATPGTEACDAAGGAFRPQWREWPGTDYWANLVRAGSLANFRLQHLFYFRVARHPPAIDKVRRELRQLPPSFRDNFDLTRLRNWSSATPSLRSGW